MIAAYFCFGVAGLFFWLYDAVTKEEKKQAAADERRRQEEELKNRPKPLTSFSFTPLLQNGERIYLKVHIPLENDRTIPRAQEHISVWARSIPDEATGTSVASYASLKGILPDAFITIIAPIKPKHQTFSPLDQLERDVALYRELNAFKAKYEDDPFLTKLIADRVEDQRQSILTPPL